jgi:hypothetical protein
MACNFDVLHNDVRASVSTYNKTYVTFSKKSKKNLVGTCCQKSCQVTRHAGEQGTDFYGTATMYSRIGPPLYYQSTVNYGLYTGQWTIVAIVVLKSLHAVIEGVE